VTLTTSFRATTRTLTRPACRPVQTGRIPLGSIAMHGMLSAAVIILGYVAVAIAAGYAAIKVIRGGPHDG